MKVLFAGPSLHGLNAALDGLTVLPPAAQGDLAKAVLNGANAIGLVDGAFEGSASVWHKEILFALSHGVAVFGAASMGALRAAECAQFGMVPVGRIANDYAIGQLDDDAAVAQLHGPAELGFPPLTETLVDARATLSALLERGLIARQLHDEVLSMAELLFFKERTVASMFSGCGEDAAALEALYRRHRVGLKSADAMALVEVLRAHPDQRSEPPSGWQLAQPPFWREALEALA
jgi:hypothetical protein